MNSQVKSLLGLNKNLLRLIFNFNDKNDKKRLLGLFNKKTNRIIYDLIQSHVNLKIINFKEYKNCILSSEGYALSIFYKRINGKNLVVAGLSDKTIKIFDIDQSTIIAIFNEHTDWINSVCDISDNEDTLKIASGSYDMFVKIWEITIKSDTANVIINNSNYSIKYSNSVYYLNRTSFNNNQECLVVCTFQKLYFYDFIKKDIIGNSEIIHSNYIYCFVNLSKFKNNYFATSSYDHMIIVSEFIGTSSEILTKKIFTLEGHTDSVWFMIYNEDYNSEILISGGWDKNIIIWSLKERNKIHFMQTTHSKCIWSLFSIRHHLFDQQYFITGGTDGKSIICNYNGEMIKEFRLHNENAIYYYGFYQDEHGKFFLLIATLEKTLGIHEIITE